MKILYIILIIFSLLYFNSNVCAGGETFSLEQCIKVAIESQPDLKSSKSNLLIAEYGLAKSKSSFYPQLSISSSYKRSGSSSASDNYSGSISVSQNIYDFGRTGGAVRKAKEEELSSDYALQGKVQETIFNVTQQYYEYLKAGRIVEVSSESLKQSEEHLQQAKDFYSSGTKPKIDVVKAEVERANDKLALISALNSLKIAKIKLANAMGLKYADFEIEDRTDTYSLDLGIEECVSLALKLRPDVREMESSVKIANLKLAAAKSSYLPSISASGGCGYSGTEFPLSSSWNAGVNISVPLFTGFSTTSDVKSAQENFNITLNNRENLELSARLEVEQAYLTVQEKRESIEAVASSLRNAEENFSLANGRYLSGVGSIIELADAHTTFSTAKANYIKSLYDYAISIASLKKAMGTI